MKNFIFVIRRIGFSCMRVRRWLGHLATIHLGRRIIITSKRNRSAKEEVYISWHRRLTESLDRECNYIDVFHRPAYKHQPWNLSRSRALNYFLMKTSLFLIWFLLDFWLRWSDRKITQKFLFYWQLEKILGFRKVRNLIKLIFSQKIFCECNKERKFHRPQRIDTLAFNCRIQRERRHTWGKMKQKRGGKIDKLFLSRCHRFSIVSHQCLSQCQGGRTSCEAAVIWYANNDNANLDGIFLFCGMNKEKIDSLMEKLEIFKILKFLIQYWYILS